MAFENPSHPLLRGVAAAGGRTVVAAEVDEQGIRADLVGPANTVFVTPAHQFPTGVVLSPERRVELIAWSGEAGALIVEDDYDGEFRYDRAPVGSLQGLAPDRVVYVGSTGKTFAPALRLGWAVLPPALFDDMSRELFSSVLQISALNQLAFASFLRRGDFDRHLRRMRQVYRARRDLVVSLLGELLPHHEVGRISAGLHVVLTMPSHAAAAAARRDAEAAGIAVELLEGHSFADYAGPAGLLIGYGGIAEPSLDRAVRQLARIIA
jgi:GntR family transcriptional regulator/MocR family aminotransferase